MSIPGIDRGRLAALRVREDARFIERTPRSRAMAERAALHLPCAVPMSWMAGLYRTPVLYADRGEGATFVDIDGNAYLDFNASDLSMSLGFAPGALLSAVSERMHKGAHFLLPTEDAIVVAELLAERTHMPFWQFTLSASGANAEVIRIAREFTGRRTVVVFGGHYHGHLEETLVDQGAGGSVPTLLGLTGRGGEHTRIVPFNDLDALAGALARRDVALVLTEPALSNCNIVLPDAQFLQRLFEECRRRGTLLCLDEAHTFQFAYGGLTRAWSLATDFLVLGKGLGTGIAFGLYGMSASLADFVSERLDIDIGPVGLATGGTLFASALAAAAARSALEYGWTEANVARMTQLGGELARGLEQRFDRRSLPWRAFHLGPRSGYCLRRCLPRNGLEANLSIVPELIDARRVFMANRGIWDAVASAGPQASAAHSAADIVKYLDVADEFLAAVARG